MDFGKSLSSSGTIYFKVVHQIAFGMSISSIFWYNFYTHILYRARAQRGKNQSNLYI